MPGLLLAISILLDPAGSFRVTGWTDAARILIGDAPRVFTIQIDSQETADLPPLAGSYSVDNGDLVFTPRYSLQPGLSYRATLKLPDQQTIVNRFTITKLDAQATTVVEQIYPSASRLPENTLKFYIYFSAPMSRGEAYQRVALLNESGETVHGAFLELAQELWDQDGRRLTLYFDPGRIKSGLLPRNESGPPILEGQTYRLVIDSEWRDARGEPLKESFSKTFTVGPAEPGRVDLAAWRIRPPAAGSLAPLTVEFPKPLDRALLEHEIEVIDGSGKRVLGTVHVDRNEMRWQFTPMPQWKSGKYVLRVGTLLADVAGNMVDRPFEVDSVQEIQGIRARKTRALSFRIE